MHVPSAARDILRRLKGDDDDPRTLLAEAQDLPDPAYAAETLFAVSGDRRLMFDEARRGAETALEAAAQIERVGRRGEVWVQLAKQARDWRDGARNPEAPKLRQRILDSTVDAVLAMPDGQWTLDAIAGAAPHVGPAGRQRLLGRALSNRGFEAHGAKAVLKAADTDAAGLRTLLMAAPPEIKAAVLADEEGLRAAWAIADDAARAEALRVLVWKEEDPERLRIIAESATPRRATDQVRLFTQVAARLDKLGHDGGALLAAAEARLPEVDEPQRGKLQRKLDEAKARAGGVPKEVVAPPVRAATPRDAPPLPAANGNVLALVNTYEGGLKVPHLRAAGRAAPLCAAFGLDLALIDFPIDDLGVFVEAVEAETNMGEGGGYLRRLYADSRVFTALPRGTVVATTPRPDEAKAIGLLGLTGPVVLLMGVGPKGLPAAMLNEAPHHHELTGHGISLETATAMGILAERLSHVAKD